MSSSLYVQPFNGIAGDMFLGALVDAGADLTEIERGLDGLGVDGWKIDITEVERHGLVATNLRVVTDEGHVHRTAADIRQLVERADLPDRVTQRAVAVFDLLARAEGTVHGKDPDDVHFHEVGGIDAIVDVVGSCLALEQLDVAEIHCDSVAVGRGAIRAAHGQLPNPAPATSILLEGWPVIGLDTTLECTTPTGAALLAALAQPGPLPPMVVSARGYGAGDAEPADMPNVLAVLLGESEATTTDAVHEQLMVLEANVDDITGETVGYVIDSLLDAGALDMWSTPIVMKKGRPAHTISVLARPLDAARLGDRLLAETGSLGYRTSMVHRTAGARTFEVVEVEGREVRIKVGHHGAKPEHDDVVAVARATGRPAREVSALALEQWRAGGGQPVQ